MPATVNAATQLAALLTGYQVPDGNTTPENHRGFNGTHDLDAWRTHHAACELVHSIDNILTGMELAGEEVEHFLEALPGWYSGVHFANTPWGQRINNKSPRPAADRNSIALLKALGTVLQAQGAITITEDARRTLMDTLEQARAIIESDLELFTADVRHYLLALLHRAETVAKQADTYGAERVREVALELGGVVFTQAEVVEKDDPEKASRLRSIGTMLVGGFMGKFGEDAAHQITQVATDAAKAITGG